ncbi:GlsB/YeaQ/YmgE family stress response membrane protein [Chondromyces crocatus]|uniref:Transglycosylase n=1 Tax=Chondromyces crocatus TaxID=52 RepID=A0A0K1E6G1_CHOCO|nr:GlsB/YeaQ/YmgE family stress response membrane protein [Chondromyces crocatus]AKT36471.1 uncharacterized protein CMC5_005860 [Chondromyces crocatus]
MQALVVGATMLAVAVVGIWLTFSLFGLLVTLAVAAAVGWLADRIVPGDLPYGWLGAIGAGLLGSWLGTLLIGPLGPRIAGIPVISALIGATILAFGVELFQKRRSRRDA